MVVDCLILAEIETLKITFPYFYYHHFSQIGMMWHLPVREEIRVASAHKEIEKRTLLNLCQTSFGERFPFQRAFHLE